MDDLGHAGEGVGRYHGQVVFVPGALPGERVRVTVTQVSRRWARARLLSVETPASTRVEPACPVAPVCGGCQLQHLDYAHQLAYKARRLKTALERIGKLERVTVNPPLGMPDPWWYRHKAQYPVQGTPGAPRLGFFRPGTHEVVDTQRCWIQSEANNQVLQVARRLLQELAIPPYDEGSDTGIIRHVVSRSSAATGEVMVVWVTRTEELPHREKLVEGLRREVRGLASVYQNINPRRTNVILGPQDVHLWGNQTIEEEVCGLRFGISPRSFFQVNPEQAEVLFRQVRRLADLQGNERVLDAYCGTGTIALCVARDAREVVGIEAVEAAVEDARANARRNGLSHVRFVEGRVEDILPAWDGPGFDVVILDPPRRGCEPPVLEAVAAARPSRIVYVSCHPETLARDLGFLSGRGYEVREVQPVDLFPHTAHVEAVTLLTPRLRP